MVYLDLCCFKRPFDDASVDRIRREAEAVAAILDMAQAGTFRLVRSPAHDFENERNPREDRRVASKPLPSPLQRAIQPAIEPARLLLSDSRLSMHCILHSLRLQRHDGS